MTDDEWSAIIKHARVDMPTKSLIVLGKGKLKNSERMLYNENMFGEVFFDHED